MPPWLHLKILFAPADAGGAAAAAAAGGSPPASPSPAAAAAPGGAPQAGAPGAGGQSPPAPAGGGGPAPGAAAPPPAQQPPAQQPPANLPGWYGQLNEQQRAALAGHNFKSAGELADKYLELEANAGRNRLVIPGENATAEELAAFREGIGVPKDPKDYKLPTENADEKFSTWARTTAHKHGLPAKAFEAFANDWQSYVGEYVQAQQAEAANAAKEDDKLLRAEWKGEYDGNMAVVKRLGEYLGWQPDTIGQVARTEGYVKGMQGLLKLAGLLDGDSAQPTGGSAFSFSTPEQAKAELDRMAADPGISKALMDANHPDHKTVTAKYDRLHEIKTGIRAPR